MKLLVALAFVFGAAAQAEVVTYKADGGIEVTIVYEKQLWRENKDQPFANFVQVILEKQSYPYLAGAKEVTGQIDQYYTKYYGRFGNDQDWENHYKLAFNCAPNDGLCITSLRRNYLWLWSPSTDDKVRYKKLEHWLSLSVDGKAVTFDGENRKHIVLP